MDTSEADLRMKRIVDALEGIQRGIERRNELLEALNEVILREADERSAVNKMLLAGAAAALEEGGPA